MKTKACSQIGQEAVDLRRVAEELANRQHEAPSTLHLLSAVALRSGPAADLLLERGITAETLMLAQSRSDPHQDSVMRVFSRAANISAECKAPSTNAVHVLVALLGEGNTAARRALSNQRVDLAQLRAAATRLNLKCMWQRSQEANAKPHRQKLESVAIGQRRVGKGETIPLFDTTSSRQGPRTTRTTARERRGQIVPLMRLPEPKNEKLQPEPEPVSAVVQAELESSAELPTPKRAHRSTANVGTTVLDPKKFPTLSAFGIPLTALAARGELDPVIGRDREIEHVLDVLAKRQGNNPILVGAPGVGKTSVVRGLAQRLVSEQTLNAVDERIIVEISIPELLSGTGVRGALAQRIVALHQEVKRAAGRVVVFFDEIHQLFMGDGADEISGELKLALARGELPCIGATTPEGYQRAIDADAALARRFSVVDVEEPSAQDARRLLSAVAEKLGQHHGIAYDSQALDDCIRWTMRYLPARQLPDKAVSVLDLAGARARRRGAHSVTPTAVAEVVASLADMPVERLTETDASRFMMLEQLIGEKVVGHQSSVQKIAAILRRNAAGLGSKRPLGTFLLLGPTGVGKTETAKALAHTLFHSETALTRIDMAEYSEPHSVARLLGAPPGYVGHDAGGQLTEAVRRRPYQIVLLDEIEKAHQDVLQSFLSVFDEGRMTDGRGRTVDFTNTVILMTSNLGSEHTAAQPPKRRVGFGAEQIVPSAEQSRAGVVAAARARLSPELYNRIDEVLVFDALSREEVREVARRLLMRTAAALTDRGIQFGVDEQSIEWLLDHGGYDISLGARPMKRILARFVEAPLAEQILTGALVSGMTAQVQLHEGQLRVIGLQ